jgi:hypothetical protein
MVAKVNLLYCVLLVCLGMCIGYYILSNLFRPSEKYIFKQGAVYGARMYKEHVHRMGTFNYVDDSTVIVITNNDSLVIYKWRSNIEK